ncbi:MAG: hypothetical protein IH948_05585 [Bacteroidetes bacterium]|nr:hypothetical protein [Bacteroidota bacterium]
MRYLILVLFVFVLHPVKAQIVSSSCLPPANFDSTYIKDAHRLALRIVYEDSLTYMDSTVIPKAYVDTIFNALMAVHNATSLVSCQWCNFG